MANGLLEDVLLYYGSNSDVWRGINNHTLTPQQLSDVAAEALGAQYFNYLNGNHGTIAHPVTFAEPPMPIVDDVSSPVSTPTYGSGGNSGFVPINIGYDSTTGQHYLYDGARTGAGSIVPTIVDRISLASIATSAGCRLGLAIDNLIYQNAPDFWNNVFGDVSPTDFAQVLGETSTGQIIGEVLFGLNEQQMTGTAYIDERIIALVYQALRDRGVFNEEDTLVSRGTPTVGQNFLMNGVSTLGILSHAMPIWASGENNPFTRWGWSEAEVTAAVSSAMQNRNLNPEEYTGYATGSQTLCNLKLIKIGTLCRADAIASYSEGPALTYTALSSTTYYNIKIENGTNNRAKATISTTTRPTYYINPIYTRVDSSGYVTFVVSGMGAEEVSANPIPGIGLQPNADYPDPSMITGNTMGDVLGQLQTYNPTLFRDPVFVDYPSPTGTGTTTVTYVPVPYTPPMTGSPTPTWDPDTGETTYTGPTTGPTLQDDTDITSPILDEVISVPTPVTETPTNVDPSPGPEPITEPTPDPTDTVNIPPTITTPPSTGDGENSPPVAPVLSASSLWAIYNPTVSQLNDFGAWLWSTNFIDQILKLFQSPMDAIIGVHAIYCTPTTGSSRTIIVGYLNSGVNSKTVTNQYVEIDCGSVYLQEYFGNVFDYTPYTKISIYLPFIGVVPLDVADVMRSTLSVKYGVDVLTGACLAMITVSRDTYAPILYTFSGDCAVRYPLSSGSYSGIISSIASAAMSALGAGIMTMGAPGTAALGAATAGVSFVRSAKLSVQHSGSFSGNSGAMGPKKPYIIIQRPITAMCEVPGNYDGYPSNTVTTIGSCHGYLKCKVVHLKVAGATKQELDEIESLLLQGILVD